MRIAIVMLAVVGLSATAFAASPKYFTVDEEVKPLASQRGVFYTQEPPHSALATYIASTGHQSELADDIPSDLAGHWIYGIVVYVTVLNGEWQDPDGVIVNFYDQQCPPGTEPSFTRYFSWGVPEEMLLEMFYDGGTWTTQRVTLWVCPPILIQQGMSFGVQVDNSWGVENPACGIVATDLDVFHGCGPGYYDGGIWAPGAPRWTSMDYMDICYSLIENAGPSAVDLSTWSSIKSLYR